MLPDQHLLRIPGPSPIPPSVQSAMSQPMVGHRGQEAKELIKQIKPKLKSVFGTKQEISIITASGTAGLEAAVVNAVQADEEVLVVQTGAFGERFAKICAACQLKTHQLKIDWGKEVTPEAVKEFLEKHQNIKAVFITYCETSTGVLNPIEEIARVVHTHSDALVIADGVSCVGSVKTEMDEWGIDILVTGSQKAMMLPAGLTFIAVSERAWDIIEKNEQPRFYLDLKKYRDNLLKDSTPFTPAISLLFGLKQVLDLMNTEGLEEIYKRHQLMMKMTREAFRALQIPLLANDNAASPTVTAVNPTDFNAEDLRSVLKKEFGLSIAGGQQHLKGKIFRIGHMGYCSPADILQTISIIEIGLTRIGMTIELGKGIKTAQEVYIGGEK